MSKKNSYLVRSASKISDFLAKRPSDYLLKKADTEDLIHEFQQQRATNTLLARCIKATITGCEGDPLQALWAGGLIDSDTYEYLSEWVSLWIDVFRLIEGAWSYLLPTLELLDPGPKNPLECFTFIIREQFDGNFIRCVKGCKITVKNMETDFPKTYKESVFQATQPGKDLIADQALDPAEERDLTAKIGGLHCPTLDLIFTVLRDELKESKDKPNRKRFEDLARKVDQIGVLQSRIVSKNRKSNSKPKILGVSWVDGKKRLGKKGGFGS